MRVKAIAEAVGVSASMLRTLEREGRIEPLPRDRAGQRRMTPDQIPGLRRQVLGLLFGSEGKTAT